MQDFNICYDSRFARPERRSGRYVADPVDNSIVIILPGGREAGRLQQRHYSLTSIFQPITIQYTVCLMYCWPMIT